MLRKILFISFYTAILFMCVLVACYILHNQKVDTIAIDLKFIGRICVYIFVASAVTTFVLGFFYFLFPDYFYLKEKK